MKCAVCRGPAVIDLRRHNANFCADHFLKFCRDQVVQGDRRARHDRAGRSGPGGRLGREGQPRAVGPPARARLRRRGHDHRARHRRLQRPPARRPHVAFAERRALTLRRIDLRGDYGYDIPTAAAVTRRVPCSSCGLSKRHLIDRAALDGGYDVVATGHNLDDEAAVLLRQRAPLAHRVPGPPAAHARRAERPERPGTVFPRKVKPLVRLTERETAAYCVLRGIDYIVEECPMAEGNRHLRYKEALNAIEDASPGAKHAFYFGFLARAADRFAPEAAVTDGELRAVRPLRRADHRRGVRLLPPRRAGGGARSGAGRARPPAPWWDPTPAGRDEGPTHEPTVRRRATRCCWSTPRSAATW